MMNPDDLMDTIENATHLSDVLYDSMVDMEISSLIRGTAAAWLVLRIALEDRLPVEEMDRLLESMRTKYLIMLEDEE